MKIMHKDIDR